MNTHSSPLTECRICQQSQFQTILKLGNLHFTGRFGNKAGQQLPSGDVSLVQCKNCDLLQLGHIYEPSEMYGATYGYRSAVTETMRNHLKDIAKGSRSSLSLTNPDKRDLPIILDIGSNDGTLINYQALLGAKSIVAIDPCLSKHVHKYPQECIKLDSFFSYEAVSKAFTGRFDIITSIAMLYDLDNPRKFINDVYSLLDDRGVWVTEQTHSHTLVTSNAYDSICHEHSLYFSFQVFEQLVESCGFFVLDVFENFINGGSFRAVLAKKTNATLAPSERVLKFRAKEEQLQVNKKSTLDNFARNTHQSIRRLDDFLKQAHLSGKKVLGYGASTKGNVLLQLLDPMLVQTISCILERDENKFGLFTPGTNIPIVDEETGRGLKPDYLLVLPWHFRDEIVARESDLLQSGCKLIFPLPKFDVIGGFNE